MRFNLSLALGFVLTTSLLAQHHHGTSDSTLDRPKVFLDKSPRVVAYQLKRLDNQRLLMVERSTEDKKFVPVYSAILSRVGMSPQYREQALQALAELQRSDRVSILLDAIRTLDPQDRDQRRAAEQLGKMLLQLPSDALQAHTTAMQQALGSENEVESTVAAAGLIVSGQRDLVIANPTFHRAFLSAIELIPSDTIRADQYDAVVRLCSANQFDLIKNDAIRALGFIADQQDQTFELIAPLVANPALRESAVATLLTVPSERRSAATSATLLAQLVDHAEQTPAEQRTSDSFIDALQLADQLMSKVPASLAQQYRSRLEAVTVRVVRIKTIAEEMRYDLPYFAVQADKAVQIVLVNQDMMPHNLVITVPGALKEVAQLGLEVGPRGVDGGLPYVPKSTKVLYATDMVQPQQQVLLTFTAPTQPGEYPYVCTFPQHWYRMYGVMVVVEDLDRWTKNPFEPANPIGSNRSFVQAWQVEDLKDELEAGLQGRSPEIGKRLFAEASCAGCHKVSGKGGVIGPELTDVLQRWRGDRVGVLREILEPSHKIDAKYAMQRILTADGQVINGVLIKEDDDTVTLAVSPDAQEPTVIAREDIERMTPAPTSMMPKALLDQYTKDEIFELLAYLEAK